MQGMIQRVKNLAINQPEGLQLKYKNEDHVDLAGVGLEELVAENKEHAVVIDETATDASRNDNGRWRFLFALFIHTVFLLLPRCSDHIISRAKYHL